MRRAGRPGREAGIKTAALAFIALVCASLPGTYALAQASLFEQRSDYQQAREKLRRGEIGAVVIDTLDGTNRLTQIVQGIQGIQRVVQHFQNLLRLAEAFMLLL